MLSDTCCLSPFLFLRYSFPLAQVWVARQPPGFAFLEFEDSRHGAAAIRGMNNKELFGCTIAVGNNAGNGPGKDNGSSSSSSSGYGGSRNLPSGSGERILMICYGGRGAERCTFDWFSV